MYLGSMLYLDFRGTYASTTRNSEPIQIGAMTLSIRNVAWWLSDGVQLIASAESIDLKQFEAIATRLVGVQLTDIGGRLEDDQLEIRFSNGWILIVDLTNQWDSDSDVAQVSLPDGRVIMLTENATLEEDAIFDDERALNWAKSPLRH